MPNKDNNIDYQMYLDYLDGKSTQSKPKPEPKPEVRRSAPRQAQRSPASAQYGFESRDEYMQKRQAGATKTYAPQKPRLSEIERKYDLDPDNIDPPAPRMTDEEFAEKYGLGKKSGRKSSRKPAMKREDEYEDIYSSEPNSGEEYYGDEIVESEYSDEPPRKSSRGGKGGNGGKKNGGKKGKNGKKKKWPIVLAVVLGIIVVLGIVAYANRAAIVKFVTNIAIGETKTGETSTGVLKRLEQGDDQNHGDKFYEGSASETNSLESWIDSWAKQSGKLMYNDKIINVLLIGMDDPNGDKYGRSDSMVIVSIDTIKKSIKMTSIWRDTYGLIQVPKTSDHSAYDTHEKINGSNFYGGPTCTVQTIENLYKVRIDGYVMTTFSSFKELIDAMGGINVDVTENENNFLNSTAPVSWHGSAGKNVLLDGKEALVYARIRHLDSDIMRTERQRKILSAIIKKAGAMSTSELFSSVTKYLKSGYVTTDFSKDDISGLGTKAVFGGWKDFEITQTTAPVSVEVDESNAPYYRGGTYNGAWVWVVDIPKTATDIQKFIYGETFCELNSSRHSLSEFISGVN